MTLDDDIVDDVVHIAPDQGPKGWRASIEKFNWRCQGGVMFYIFVNRDFSFYFFVPGTPENSDTLTPEFEPKSGFVLRVFAHVLSLGSLLIFCPSGLCSCFVLRVFAHVLSFGSLLIFYPSRLC